LGTPEAVESLNLPQDQFRFLSVVRQGGNAKLTKKENGNSGEVEKSGGGSRISKEGGGIKFGMGFGIWTWGFGPGEIWERFHGCQGRTQICGRDREGGPESRWG